MMRILFNYEELGILGRGGDGGGGGGDGAAQAAADYGVANQQASYASLSGDEMQAGLLDKVVNFIGTVGAGVVVNVIDRAITSPPSTPVAPTTPTFVDTSIQAPGMSFSPSTPSTTAPTIADMTGDRG